VTIQKGRNESGSYVLKSGNYLFFYLLENNLVSKKKANEDWLDKKLTIGCFWNFCVISTQTIYDGNPVIFYHKCANT
jgi:hypothetical protein